MTDPTPNFDRARANWQAIILVCRKCEKRMGDEGFGPRGKTRLAKALKKSVKASAKAHGRKSKGRAATVGIVEIGCQKLCPKSGVTVILDGRPDRWLIAREGAEPEQLLTLAGVDLKRP